MEFGARAPGSDQEPSVGWAYSGFENGEVVFSEEFGDGVFLLEFLIFVAVVEQIQRGVVCIVAEVFQVS